ncbi:TetR/AcrR family transcriptional regulator [uncultured Pseudoteredinibacter sp.]|uniref:TetR/AcrR family transcriptional regulator n=1 Tax=uncultured Pseudoteredinibacter sp. TaxID=1641701 RepID=UPI0026098F1E|nr:TetR/AcrR family transcriptional regulator [uncultured Pseudoteredinibacter sp.]
MPFKKSHVPPDLLEKNKPQQQRAVQTYEGILNAASELLVELGVERISTNLIAERAGITVPALYRYFKNKYAVLYALGARLMDRQNQILVGWHETYFDPSEPEKLFVEVEGLVRETYDVTREQPASLAVLSAMRAIPILQEVRLQSHKRMTQWLLSQWEAFYEIDDEERIGVQSRMSMEVAMTAVEMSIEDSETSADIAIEEAAKIIVLYWRDMISRMSYKGG